MRNLKKKVVFSIILLIIGIFTMDLLKQEKSKGENMQVVASIPTTMNTTPVQVADINDTKMLNLVNHQYPVQQIFAQDSLVSVFPHVATNGEDIQLHERALNAVSQLFSSAEQANIHNIFVNSGYRCQESQATLYEGAEDKSFVMPAGHSEHQTGLGIDIAVEEDGNGIADERDWLAENADKYGLILRYTEDKQHITGIADEPWHFRYVGQPHATFMKEKNIAFEEYIEFLQANEQYRVIIEGVEYEVFYQVAENGMIQVPETADYEISSDNTGGYIITVRL